MEKEAKKVLTFEEVSKHNQIKDCWLIMFGKVYDITSFMDDHPGGDEVLLSSTSKDATMDFEDVGHSKSAMDMLDKYYIGDIDASTVPVGQAYVAPRKVNTAEQGTGLFVKILQLFLPLLILGFAFAIQHHTRAE